MVFVFSAGVGLETPKKRVRKRIPDANKWKCNKLRKAHQSGEEYISAVEVRRLNQKPSKTPKTASQTVGMDV